MNTPRIIVIAGCAALLLGLTACGPRPTPTAAAPAANDAEIAALFDRWNEALQTGEPENVAALYAEDSVLLPTMSNRPRLTAAERIDYFEHFLEKQPVGRIELRRVVIRGELAADSGLYTFVFGTTGESVRARYTFVYRRDEAGWRIVSHHSSAMPEP